MLTMLPIVKDSSCFCNVKNLEGAENQGKITNVEKFFDFSAGEEVCLIGRRRFRKVAGKR